MTLQAERTPTTYGRPAAGLVNGTWVKGEGERFDVINPATEEVIANVAGFSLSQADDAVAAAAAAFHGGEWGRTPARERAQMLYRLADLLERDQDALIELMVAEIGTPF